VSPQLHDGSRSLTLPSIVCLIFAYQNFSGNVIGNQATYFFERE
jgi:hypothetical protein